MPPEVSLVRVGRVVSVEEGGGGDTQSEDDGAGEVEGGIEGGGVGAELDQSPAYCLHLTETVQSSLVGHAGWLVMFLCVSWSPAD